MDAKSKRRIPWEVRAGAERQALKREVDELREALKRLDWLLAQGRTADARSAILAALKGGAA